MRKRFTFLDVMLPNPLILLYAIIFCAGIIIVPLLVAKVFYNVLKNKIKNRTVLLSVAIIIYTAIFLSGVIAFRILFRNPEYDKIIKEQKEHKYVPVKEQFIKYKIIEN